VHPLLSYNFGVLFMLQFSLLSLINAILLITGIFSSLLFNNLFILIYIELHIVQVVIYGLS
jgi:hypothetical protein